MRRIAFALIVFCMLFGRADANAVNRTYMPMVTVPARLPLGIATHPSYLQIPGYGEAVAEHMSFIVPEVAGKYGYVAENGWADMDYLVAWADANGLRVHYHTLLWWWEFPPDPEAWIREAIARYPSIQDWDVANEAWDASGNALYPFVADAYRLARTLTSARLWYNGILTSPAEQEKAIELVQSGLADGIGIQMHLSVDANTDLYIPFLERLRDAGIAWRVSELDVAIEAYTTKELLWQAQVYGNVRQMLDDYGGVSGTTWGLTDNTSWIEPYFPLPFDAGGLPKPCWDAWRGVVDT